MIEEIKPLIPLSDKFDIELDLGGKIIHLKKWKVKDRRDFVKAIESGEDKQQAIKNLIYGSIKEEVYLSESELNYVLIQLKKLSIVDEIEVNYFCDCGKLNKISTSLTQFEKIKKFNLTKSSNNDVQVVFNFPKDYNLVKEIINITKLEEDTLFAEMLLHIKSVYYEGEMYNNFTFEELFRFIESIPNDIYQSIIISWNTQKFMFNMGYENKCDCGIETTVVITDFISLLDEWI